jgi:hypothetical protein
MNPYDNARLTEARGMAVLEPFLSSRADGRLVMLEHGPLARALQESTGDAIFQFPGGRVYSVEVKVEEENKYGNIFAETWSNRNLEDRNNHAKLGSNPGWFVKLRADLLFYYFLSSDDLYVFDFFKLQRWAFGSGDTPGRLYDFREKRQRVRLQANDTWGRCVPIADLASEVGYRLINPKQLPLFTEMDAIE